MRLLFLAALLFFGESLLAAEAARRKSPTRKPPQAADSAGPINAIFVFGDSLQDVGNNNYGKSVLQFNIPPYGTNFIPQSGRVCDGKLGIDFLGK
ncbi:unnamed protein product [Closterium sp. Yama58-4]|nr:unnamed protein product [Closterium sp. Yama58-4]